MLKKNIYFAFILFHVRCAYGLRREQTVHELREVMIAIKMPCTRTLVDKASLSQNVSLTSRLGLVSGGRQST